MILKRHLRKAYSCARGYYLAVSQPTPDAPRVTTRMHGVLKARFRHRIGPRHYSLFRLATVDPSHWQDYVIDNKAYGDHFRAISAERHRSTVSRKSLFFAHCVRHGLPTPPVQAIIPPGHETPPVEGSPEGAGTVVTSARRWLEVLQAGEEDLFIKPDDGAYGDGAFSATRRNDRWHYCGRVTALSDLFYFVRARASQSQTCFIAQSRIQPHDKLSGLMSPTAVGCVRIVTYMRDGKARLFCAEIKLTAGEGDTDNFGLAANGNMVAAVDMDSGRLSLGYTSRSPAWPVIQPVTEHPDTGEPIEGTPLPLWEEVKALALQAQRSLPEVKTIGWDIAITPEGPLILEGNTTYGLASLQIAHQRGFRREMEQIFRG
ncbi:MULTISPECIES: sugar-transfer associated ATP-grasp domain-containing protein [unclassified Thioalkalivibrio]|uniref:sugar-transfer associated ATP-grasp domain-containing protein n=1 Tax=unclassified Thioalkalivibrio TaxID=2621013 RepID=UPI00035C6B09|nr:MULTISPECIES: sugar-transfer associated ATP-grasp domain-containing protein [unclassified Thioalkalivibrio]